MFDDISNVSAYHVQNDRMSGGEKNLITPHDISRQNVLQSDNHNSQNAGSQAC